MSDSSSSLAKVLLVNETPDRAVAQYILEKEGYAVDVINGLDQVWNRLEGPIPDVLVLDCSPACAEFRHLVETLKAAPRTAEMAVVAFTDCAHLADPCDTCSACQNGFDRTLSARQADELPATLDEILRGPIA